MAEHRNNCEKEHANGQLARISKIMTLIDIIVTANVLKMADNIKSTTKPFLYDNKIPVRYQIRGEYDRLFLLSPFSFHACSLSLLATARLAPRPEIEWITHPPQIVRGDISPLLLLKPRYFSCDIIHEFAKKGYLPTTTTKTVYPRNQEAGEMKPDKRPALQK